MRKTQGQHYLFYTGDYENIRVVETVNIIMQYKDNLFCVS